MGLDIVLYNLDETPPAEDERGGRKWYAHGKAFVAWLRDGNAVYRHLRNRQQIDISTGNDDFLAARKCAEERVRWYAEHGMMSKKQALDTVDVLNTEEKLAGLLAGEVVDVFVLESSFHLDIYERPKDFAMARDWIRVHVEWEPENKRFLDLLKLLESDENLWLYESW
jgi:hypothetical protein